MKKKCLFLMLICGAFNLFAQNSEVIQKNPAEIFASKKGTTIEKRFDEVGKVGYLNIQIEYITDLNNSDKAQCIRFDIQLAGSNATGPSALLDSNEVTGLLQFLKYINNNVTKHPPADPNTEISYTDTYDLQIGCFWQKSSGWTVFIRTIADNPSTETAIYQADINGLIRTLELAKTEMKKS
jgi:hypothetical protein